MAITAIDNLSPSWYTPDCEKDEDVPTRFNLRPLDGLEYMEVISEVTKHDSGDFAITSKGMQKAIRSGVVGWENFKGSTGKDIKFSPHNLNKVPPLILQELAGEIIERSELGAEAEKN
jgi:hypothetical protein